MAFKAAEHLTALMQQKPTLFSVKTILDLSMTSDAGMKGVKSTGVGDVMMNIVVNIPDPKKVGQFLVKFPRFFFGDMSFKQGLVTMFVFPKSISSSSEVSSKIAALI
jgi:hypothetical protein